MVAVAACAAFGVGVAVAPGSAAQAGGRYGPHLVAKLAVPTIKAGVASWGEDVVDDQLRRVRRDVCDVRVTVTGAHGGTVDVTYPSNTATFTSLSRAAHLAKGDADYASLRVVAGTDRTGWITLKLAVSYTKLPDGTLRPHSNTDADVDCTGKRSQRATTARMFVRV